MKGKFKQVPEALQKQIIIRFTAATLFSLLFVILLAVSGDAYLYIPCLLFAGSLFANAALLQYNCLSGNFVSVSGVCTHIEATPFRKRIKSITLKLDDNKQLTISVRRQLKRLQVGDTVIVYLPEKAHVYTRDGEYWMNSYYAIEIRKEAFSRMD